MMYSKICSLHLTHLLQSSRWAAPGAQIQIFIWPFDQGHWLDIKLDTFLIVIVWETHTEIGAKWKLHTKALHHPGIESRTFLWDATVPSRKIFRKKQDKNKLWATIKGFLFFQFVQAIIGLYWQLGKWEKRESWRFGLSQARHCWPSCSSMWLYGP